MISLKTNGDTIANEFLKLIGNSSEIKKEASLIGVEPTEITIKGKSVKGAGFEKALEQKMSEVKDQAESYMKDQGMPPSGGTSEEIDAASFLVDSASDGESIASDALDSTIESFSSKRTRKRNSGVTINGREKALLDGLGKIALKLRRKGEAFAADMVDATRVGVKGDIAKEAAKRNNVNRTLSKIASNLRRDGDSFAADVVSATIANINNS